MSNETITDIVAGISAAAGLITALAMFLNVLPKLGIHNAQLAAVTTKVDDLAVKAEAAAVEAKRLEPAAVVAVVTPPAATPPAA